MDNHYQLNDLEFEAQFANGTLAPSLFNHEAHLRLAWIHLKQYGYEIACHNICRQIKAFDKLHGDGTKFNKTVTIAAINTVYHFMNKSQTTNFKALIDEFPRLKNEFKSLIDMHYGFDIFKSKQAKREYLKPDLLPYDTPHL